MPRLFRRTQRKKPGMQLLQHRGIRLVQPAASRQLVAAGAGFYNRLRKKQRQPQDHGAEIRPQLPYRSKPPR